MTEKEVMDLAELVAEQQGRANPLEPPGIVLGSARELANVLEGGYTLG